MIKSHSIADPHDYLGCQVTEVLLMGVNRPGHRLDEHFLAAGVDQGISLEIEILFKRRDAGVADIHDGSFGTG